MKATETNLLSFLKKSSQFSVPIYQRTYSWTESQCRQLWDDILQAGHNDDISAHFVGSIVYIEKGVYSISIHSPLLVIDGQQRLTTVSLIIEALARRLGESEPLDGFSVGKLRNYYLLNPEEKNERRYKLLLTQTDKQSLLSIVDQKSLPAEHAEYSLRVQENFDYFERWIKDIGDDLAPLCKGLTKLMIVDISLDRERDNPQLIFESMNSTGLELSQADLIRNFILMGLGPDHQTRLYNEHWRPMEKAFGQEAYSAHFDGFMRHYLTLKTGEIPKLKEVYEAFKIHAGQQDTSASVDDLVADLHTFAGYYCAMALGKEPDRNLDCAFHDLRELKVDVAYPFLLELYHDYSDKVLSADELEQAVRMVESYVFRRAVCAIPTNSLNTTFSTFGRTLKKDRYLDSIRAHFLLLPSYRRFPSNEEFSREITVRDLYNFRNRSYWLRRLENHERKERVSIHEYTIEHILPQNPDLSLQWRDVLGPEWKQVQEKWLHTLGNLTLTGYNAELSDRPFSEKRDMEGGFRDSPLRVNEYLRTLEIWNEEEIQNRATDLARKAVAVWSAPSLPAEELEVYRPEKKKEPGAYNLDDHPHLAEGSYMRPLFDRFRKEVLAIDPCVFEDFRKTYIAYKAETNFVDVVPQVRRLRLSLNLKFHELDDPHGLAKDVTNIGRWGNGDAEIGLSNLDELPYVLGLVRQAFEKQMGNEDVDA